MGFAFDSLPKAAHAVLSGAAIFPAAPFLYTENPAIVAGLKIA